ncbi:MAG: RnfABCDGE type electron transport complex subunit B [Candidatus Krumholzibacteria bacterium]|nr:RnfABCDGE type electron transport complex subunit B [Candidatus Krumholzibacteria bacterium]
MLTAVTAMAILALALAFGIAMAARIFAVVTDPRAELIEGALPGANCGACGLPGCSELARRIAEGKAPVGACPVGGEPVAAEIARIMGEAFEGGCERQVALVLCNGSDQVAAKRFFYNGVFDCASAALVAGGDKACTYGCLGFGTCAAVCPFGAIDMLPGGLAVVDPSRCTGCTKCVSACPRGIIRMVPAGRRVHILCSNHEKGAAAKKKCAVACIACQKCVKAAPEGAITMDNFLAVVDYSKDIPDPVAAECPMSTIVVRPGEACAGDAGRTAAAGGEG